jgi:hypothetical protein
VIVGAFVWQAAGRRLPGGMAPYVVAGTVFILAHLLLRWEDISRRVGRRQLLYGSNTAVLTLAVLGILGLVNCPGFEGWPWSKGLVHRYPKRWDFTKGQRYSLSEQTTKILAGLKEDVHITYFQRSAEIASGRDRLRPFEAASPRLKLEFVDPNKNPSKARQHEVTRVPTIVVQRGERHESLSSDSEQDLVNALIKVTRDTKKTVCFSEGEGERDPEDSDEAGYSQLKAGLGASGYQVKKTLLLREGKVPTDCSVLVVAGPQKDLLPGSIEAIRSFVRGGGRGVVMVEPEFKESYPQLTGLLKEWNIEAGNDLVVDASLRSQLAGAGFETPLAARYPFHEITRDFRIATAFHTARSVQAGKATPEGVAAQNLIETSEASWAQSDLKTIHEEGPQSTDRMGPISVAAVATIRAPAPKASPSPPASPPPASAEKPPTPEGRVIVFGDADFVSNKLLRFPGNKDFILNTVAWLAEDVDLISIRPHEPDDQRMFLTGGQMQNVFIVSLLLLPGLFVVLGLVSWWGRRAR